MKKRKINKGYLFVYIVLTLYTLYTIYPLFLMIITSLKPNLEIMKNPSGLPTSLYLDGFKTLFGKMDFSKYLINTTFVTIVSCVALLVISLMLSYVLARYKSRLSNFLYMFVLVGMMVPLRLGLPSLNDLLYNTGLIDNLWGLIFIYIAINLSYTMLLLTGFIKMIPVSLEESAFIDGANTWQILWKVVFPLIKPAVATTFIYNFVPIWNDAFFPLIFIGTDEKKTLMQAVTMFFGQYTTNWNLVFCAMTVACLPVIIVYICCARYLIRGMMAGALKG